MMPTTPRTSTCQLPMGQRVLSLAGRSLVSRSPARSAPGWTGDSWAESVEGLSARALPTDGETTDPDAGIADHCDGARVEVCFDSGQVREQDHRLFVRSSSSAATEQDYRRDGGVSCGKQTADVGVGRHEHAAFGGGAGENLEIVSSREPVARHVDGVMSSCREVVGQLEREALVDEEPRAGRAGGRGALGARPPRSGALRPRPEARGPARRRRPHRRSCHRPPCRLRWPLGSASRGCRAGHPSALLVP